MKSDLEDLKKAVLGNILFVCCVSVCVYVVDRDETDKVLTSECPRYVCVCEFV